jgi:hypothetical protein
MFLRHRCLPQSLRQWRLMRSYRLSQHRKPGQWKSEEFRSPLRLGHIRLKNLA